MRPSGRVAIVTGGASGIGASVCERFAAEGAAVVVVDRDEAGATRRAAELDGAEAVGLDVTDVEAVDACVARVASAHERLDALVSIAGVDDPEAKALVGEQLGACDPLEVTSTLSDEQRRRMLSINLDGTFNFLRAALRAMLPQRSGSIVNMSSIAGVAGVAGVPHDSASKAAIIGLTQSVAKEVGDRGVRVNAIAPGGTLTPTMGRAPEGMAPAGVPMGAQPEELAAIIAFLASDDASSTTGDRRHQRRDGDGPRPPLPSALGRRRSRSHPSGVTLRAARDEPDASSRVAPASLPRRSRVARRARHEHTRILNHRIVLTQQTPAIH